MASTARGSFDNIHFQDSVLLKRVINSTEPILQLDSKVFLWHSTWQHTEGECVTNSKMIVTAILRICRLP